MTVTDKTELVEAALVEQPPPLGLRLATVADVPGIHALLTDRERHFFGEASTSQPELEKLVGGASSRMFVPADSDRFDIATFLGMQSWSEFNFGTAHASIGCDPARALESLRWSIELARLIDPQKTTISRADDVDTDKIALLDHLGGTVIRRWAEMRIPLDPTGVHARPPALPDNVEIRALDGSDADWRITYDVVNTAFLDHFANQGQEFDDFVESMKVWIDDWSLCWVACVNGRPASVLLGETRPTDGYIATLGTLREFRKLGLGKLLLLTSFAEFASRGFPTASLDVDQTNPTGAVGLYESVGMTMVHRSASWSWPPLVTS